MAGEMKPKASKYEQVYNGQWFDTGQEIEIACCDCHLVHEFTFRLNKETNRAEMRINRNNRKTAALRQHHGVPVKRKAK